MSVDISGMSEDDVATLAIDRAQAEPTKRHKVFCCICGHEAHRLAGHIKDAHNITVREYRTLWPGVPVRSPFAIQEDDVPHGVTAKSMMEFNIGSGKASVPLWEGWDAEDASWIPDWDEDFELNGTVDEYMGQIALGLETAENVMIIGPTGGGKTSIVDAMASLTNQPVTRINFHGDMRPSDLVGEVELQESADGNAVTRWVDGPLTRGFRRGHIILIDEIDASPPQLHTLLQRLCERHPSPLKAIAAGKPHMKMMLPSGELVLADPKTRLICTANTVGTGDMTGEYNGTFILNAAFLDRWGIKIKYAYPEKPVWQSILVKKCGVSSKTAEAIVDVAIKINEAKSRGTCRTSLSPRKTMAWARLANRIGKLRTAADLAIINGIDAADPDHRFIADIIAQIVGR